MVLSTTRRVLQQWVSMFSIGGISNERETMWKREVQKQSMHSDLYFVLFHFKTLSRYKRGCITFWTPFIKWWWQNVKYPTVSDCCKPWSAAENNNQKAAYTHTPIQHRILYLTYTWLIGPSWAVNGWRMQLVLHNTNQTNIIIIYTIQFNDTSQLIFYNSWFLLLLLLPLSSLQTFFPLSVSIHSKSYTQTKTYILSAVLLYRRHRNCTWISLSYPGTKHHQSKYFSVF